MHAAFRRVQMKPALIVVIFLQHHTANVELTRKQPQPVFIIMKAHVSQFNSRAA